LHPGPSVAPSRRETEHAISTRALSTQTSSRYADQPLDGALGLLVASFADVVVANDAVRVDESSADQ